jgi:hypothetical protein
MYELRAGEKGWRWGEEYSERARIGNVRLKVRDGV